MRIVSVTDVENVYLWNMCVIASIVESSDHMYCSAFGFNELELEWALEEKNTSLYLSEAEAG